MKTIIQLGAFLYFLFLSANLIADTPINGGDVSGTWAKTGSPFIVNGHITIPDDETLVIEPGVEVRFTGYYRLLVEGTIIAIGETNDTILFTSGNPATFYDDLNSPDGSWSGLDFINYYPVNMDDNDTSRLIRCKFQYAKAVDEVELRGKWGGAILVDNFDRLAIEKCHFTDNYANYGGAIGTNGANFTIEDCLIRNSHAATGGGVFGQGGHITLIDNLISYNTSTSSGAGIGFWGGSEFTLIRNTVSYNSASSHGGGIYTQSSSLIAINNIIANNYSSSMAGGIYNITSYPTLTGNIICNNEAGSGYGGIYLNKSDAIMTNNTICNNAAVSTAGGMGIYECSPVIRNCIFHGNNLKQIYLIGSLAFPDFYNSLVEGDLAGLGGTLYGDWEHIIDGDPQFFSPTPAEGKAYNAAAANWSLQSTSPCINAGTEDLAQLDIPEYDVYGNIRIRNQIIDLGAAEKHIDEIIHIGNITSDVFWFADTVKITSDVTVTDGNTLSINPGTVIQFQGHYELNIQGRLLAVGNEDAPIVFTCRPEDIGTGWKHIVFNNTGAMNDNDTSFIKYCHIEYGNADGPGGTDDCGGAVYAKYFSKLVIANNLIENNSASYMGGGIYCNYCAPLIKENIIRDNTAQRGGAIASDHASPDIIGNQLINNDASELADGVFAWFANNYFRDNFITGHYEPIRGWGGTGKRYVLINNIIVNNDCGVQLSDNDIYAFNNTICNNQSYNLYCSDANLYLYNSILRGGARISVNGIGVNASVVNCNIEDGESAIIGSVTATTGNIIDEEAYYYEPPSGSGKGFTTYPENWQILPVSPCINAGVNNLPGGYDLPGVDYAGNPRINDGIADIGAYENQGSTPDILTHPVGGIKCTGDTLILRIEVNDTSFYQWQKDGQDISGATSNHLDLLDLSQIQEGNYNCKVTNSYGTMSSATVLLIVKSPPEILYEPEDMWIKKGISLDLQVTTEGTPPVQFQWYKNDVIIVDADKPILRFQYTDYSIEGIYHCEISNACGQVETTPATLFVAPELCMVTVDTATGNNLIVWEKQSTAPILYFNIYREGVIAGFYDLIGSVPFSNLSVFVDTAADPTVQAYWYKITAVNDVGEETDLDLCTPHKTIHLLVTMNPETGATQLDWDRYIGFTYGTFHILRSTIESGFTIYHSMASSTTTFSDLNPEQDPYFYRVAVEKTGLCSPAGSLKAGSGPYSHSMSNLEDNRLQATEENNMPTLISISDTTITENMIVGSFVGKLQTTDPDANDIHSYSLVDGPGDDDNLSFTILGDLLISAEVFDFETKGTYNIRIRSTDNGSGYLYVERVFTIAILDASESGINNSPSDITLSKDSIQENLMPASLVGRLQTADPDTADAHTYTLMSGSGDTGNNSFSIMGNLLISAETFDFETKSEYSIRIRSTDNGVGNLYTEETFIITILNVDETVPNQSPTDISLDNSDIDENKPVGTLIGRFGSTDPNENDNHTYYLVSGSGDTDNSKFSILGDLLISAGIFDFEINDQYNIRVRSTDDGDGRMYLEKEFVVTVNNLLEVGTDDIGKDQILVYPNPFDKTTRLVFPNEEGKEYKLYIMDLSGKVVRIEENITTSRIVIHRENLNNGYYIIKLIGEKIFRGNFVIADLSLKK